MLTFFLIFGTAAAAYIRVNPSGSSGDVTSLHTAQALARQFGSATIELLPGIHQLDTSLVLDERDNHIRWVGSSSTMGEVIVSGGRNITNWQKCVNNPEMMCADILQSFGALAQPRHLYINGRRVNRGRVPLSVVSAFVKPIAVDDNMYVVDVNLSQALLWHPLNAPQVEMVYTAQGSPWTESRCTVNFTHAHSASEIEVWMKQPCFTLLQHKPCGQTTFVPAYIENAGANYLQAGEWFLDYSVAGSLLVTYFPLPGEDVTTEVVVMPVLEQLIVSSNIVDVGFENITFEYATWSRPNQGLGFIEQQSGALILAPDDCVDSLWFPMPSNIVFSHSSNVSIFQCVFRHMGAGALQFFNGSHDTKVDSCHFYDLSGTAIQLGAYNTSNTTDPAFQELRNTISNNLIENVGMEFHGAAGLQIGYSSYTTVSQNEIRNLTYSGLSLGWGWAREPNSYDENNIISGNYIHHFKLQTSTAALGDGGGIYALGPQKNSIITGNWLSHMGTGRGGGAIYPDEGSAFWNISRNVFSNASFCQDDCEWLHIWTPSIHDISTSDCYVDTATMENHGTNTPVSDVVVVQAGSPWPTDALDIMSKAGPHKSQTELRIMNV